MTRNHTSRRSGFTLIELLVVIAIIAVLGGLVLGGVMRVNAAKYRLKTKDEMSQLQTDLANFDQAVTGGKSHVPSRLLLREDGNYSDPQIIANGWGALAQDSYVYLKTCFPECGLVGMDWNGDGAITAGASGMFYLEGSQCLVFFLGGINGLKGFSSNPKNPTDARTDRIGPFFHFPAHRLQPVGAVPNAAFPGFIDPYETMPYAFFSSYKRKDGYNRYGFPGITPGAVSDCSSLNLEPYWISEVVSAAGRKRDYYNPNGYQIISAGKDKVFGPGGKWPPATGIGWDDMANFHIAQLGSAP